MTKQIRGYVDGSHSTNNPDIAGWGVHIEDGRCIGGQIPDDGYRQVAGEIRAAKELISLAEKEGYSKVVIFYDYRGLEEWANGSWKAKNSMTQEYVQFVQAKRESMEIKFVHVSPEQNRADAIAREYTGAKAAHAVAEPTEQQEGGQPMKIEDLAKESLEGVRTLIPYTSGESIMIVGPSETVDNPEWAQPTALGDVGGLAGRAVANGDAFLMELIILGPSMSENNKGLVFTMLNNLEDTMTKFIAPIKEKFSFEVNGSHPEYIFQKVSATTRNANWVYLSAHRGEISFGKPVDGMIGSGDTYYRVRLLITRKGAPTLRQSLANNNLLPERNLTAEESAKVLGKEGKYYFHTGYPLLDIHLQQYPGTFPGEIQDGQAYASVDAIPAFLEKAEEMAANAEDPQLKSLATRSLDVLRPAAKMKAPVHIKGWSSGSHGFGKGTLAFIPAEDFRKKFSKDSFVDGNPVVVADEDWVKMSAHTDGSQMFYLHDVVGLEFKRDNEGKTFAVPRQQDVGSALIDSAFPTDAALEAFAKSVANNGKKMVAEVHEDGVSSLIERDLDKDQRLAESVHRTYGEAKRAGEAINLAMLNRLFKIAEDGHYLYAAAPWEEGMVEADELVLNPVHRYTFGDKGSTVLVTRYPVVSPAGAKWLKVRYSNKVAINGCIVSTTHCEDYGLDFDGDRLQILPMSELVSTLYASRPENYSVPQTKGLMEEREANANPAATDNPDIRAVLRGGIAQQSVGLADTERSYETFAYIREHGPDIKGLCQHLMKALVKEQELLDSIKKANSKLPEFEYRPMPSIWRATRRKADTLGKLTIKKNYMKDVKALEGTPWQHVIPVVERAVSYSVQWAKLDQDNNQPNVNKILQTPVSSTARMVSKRLNEMKLAEVRYCKIHGGGYMGAVSNKLVPSLREEFTNIMERLGSAKWSDEMLFRACQITGAAAFQDKYQQLKKVPESKMPERVKRSKALHARNSVMSWFFTAYPQVRARFKDELLTFPGDLSRSSG